MAAHGEQIRRVDGLFLSHEHSDHARCAGIYQRKFGLPIYATGATASASRRQLGPVRDLRRFEAGQTLELGEALVHTLPTPHDAIDSICFVIEHAGRRLGLLTDLGHPFEDLRRLLPTLDAVYLESNYDPELLRTGPYPAYLKARIAGDRGHISNHEAGALLQEHTGRRLRWAALSHLSQTNNTPDLALQTVRRALGRRRLPLHVAGRHGVSELFRV